MKGSSDFAVFLVFSLAAAYDAAMALIACKECKKEMSSAADACPHCGWKPVRSSPLGFGVALFIISAIIFFLVGPLYAAGFFVLFGLIGAVVISRR